MIVLKTVSKDIHLLGKKTAANWNKVSITVQFSPWFAKTKHLNNISSQRRFLENEQNLDIDIRFLSQPVVLFFFIYAPQNSYKLESEEKHYEQVWCLAVTYSVTISWRGIRSNVPRCTQLF